MRAGSIRVVREDSPPGVQGRYRRDRRISTTNFAAPPGYPYGQCRHPLPQQSPRFRWYQGVKTMYPFS